MSGSRVGRVLVAGGLTLAAFVALVFLAVPALLVPGDGIRSVVLTYSLPEFGFAAVGVAFLVAIGKDRSFLDVSRPTLSDVGVTVAATLGLVALNLGAHWVLAPAGYETATRFSVPSGVDPFALFVALSVVFVVVVGPTEELFFRGVVQRYLAESLSARGAYAWTSVFFAALHLPGVAGAGGGPTQYVLVAGVLFVVSWVLCWLYDRTRNLVVPVLVHGFYDVLVFAALLLDALP